MGEAKGELFIFIIIFFSIYRVFSLDVTVAVFVSQNNETATMLVYQTKLFLSKRFLFFSDKLA